MKRGIHAVCAFILAVSFLHPTFAREIPAEQVRETFWTSGQEDLQLASEALGDESLMEYFQRLLKNADLKEEIKEILKKLTD